MSEFDFEEGSIGATIIGTEIRARHAEDWAESRVAIAENRANLACLVAIVSLFLVGASMTTLLMSGGQCQQVLTRNPR